MRRVTTIVKNLFEIFDTYSIIDKNKKLWDQDENSIYHKKSKEEIKTLWKNNGIEAAKLGTKLHDDIEYFYKGKPVENNTREYKFFLDFDKWRKTEGWEPYKFEWRMYDNKNKITGCIDALFKKGEDYILVDWKRCKDFKTENYFGKKGTHPATQNLDDCELNRYSIQLMLYCHLLELQGIKPKEIYIINFHPVQLKYRIYTVENNPEIIKKILD